MAGFKGIYPCTSSTYRPPKQSTGRKAFSYNKRSYGQDCTTSSKARQMIRSDIWMVVFGAIICLACGSDGREAEPPSPLRAEFAYVANQADDTVSGYSIDATTGALTPIPGSPFATGTSPLSIAVDPVAKLIYVSNGDNSVSGYSVNGNTGALKPVQGSPFRKGFNHPTSISIDPTAKFVYVANNGNGTVSGFSMRQPCRCQYSPRRVCCAIPRGRRGCAARDEARMITPLVTTRLRGRYNVTASEACVFIDARLCRAGHTTKASWPGRSSAWGIRTAGALIFCGSAENRYGQL